MSSKLPTHMANMYRGLGMNKMGRGKNSQTLSLVFTVACYENVRTYN